MLMHRVVHLKKCAGCAGHNIIEDQRAGDEVTRQSVGGGKFIQKRVRTRFLL